jgi:hypothetical protein
MTEDIYKSLKRKLDDKGYVFYYMIDGDKVKQIEKGVSSKEAKQNLLELVKKHKKKLDGQMVYRAILTLYKPKKLNEALINGIISVSIKNFKVSNNKIVDSDVALSKLFWVPVDQVKLFKFDTIKMMVKGVNDRVVDFNPMKTTNVRDIKKMNIVITGKRILKS